jgi:hypothetical protein
MSNRNNTRSGTLASEPSFPARLKARLADERPLLDALTTLRSLGQEGVEAVDAISKLRRISTLKLSWELWEALVEGDGDDPEVLLVDEVPVNELDRARAALFGSWRDDDRRTRRLEVVGCRG